MHIMNLSLYDASAIDLFWKRGKNYTHRLSHRLVNFFLPNAVDSAQKSQAKSHVVHRPSCYYRTCLRTIMLLLQQA